MTFYCDFWFCIGGLVYLGCLCLCFSQVRPGKPARVPNGDLKACYPLDGTPRRPQFLSDAAIRVRGPSWGFRTGAKLFSAVRIHDQWPFRRRLDPDIGDHERAAGAGQAHGLVGNSTLVAEGEFLVRGRSARG
jgi:hypothetical protein